MGCHKLFALNSHWTKYEMLHSVAPMIMIFVQTRSKKLNRITPVFQTTFASRIVLNSTMIICILLLANIHLISSYHSISATESFLHNIDPIDPEPEPYPTRNSYNHYNLYNSFDTLNSYNLYGIYRPIALQMNQLLLLTSSNINQQKSINDQMLMKTTDDCMLGKTNSKKTCYLKINILFYF